MSLSNADADRRFDEVVKVFIRRRGVTAGVMMSSPGLKLGGKIFAMLCKGKFVAKLPRERVNKLVSNGDGERFDPGHGRLMKEWFVATAPDLDWAALAEEAFEYARMR